MCVCVGGGGGGGGEGGGAYLKNWDQIINVRTIRYASSADTQRRVSNVRTIKLELFGTTFNGTGIGLYALRMIVKLA